jgi:hypothetical protein
MCADDRHLLKAMKNRDESAAEKSLPLVYNELHRLAKSYMRRERRTTRSGRLRHRALLFGS